MTRHEFLKTKVPVIPYLVWNTRNSNKYHELIAGDYGKKRFCLSWTTFKPECGKSAGGEVTAYYNDTSLLEKKWYKELFRTDCIKEYKDLLDNLEVIIIK